MNVVPGHYSAHCIPDLEQTLKAIERLKLRPDAENFAKLIQKVKTAVKFIMPPDGTFTDEIGAALPDQIALPFDVVALEYHTGVKGAPLKPTDARCSRRIVIASTRGENEIMVEAIGYFDWDRRWEALPWAATVSMGPPSIDQKVIDNMKGKSPQPHFHISKNASGLYPLTIVGAILPEAMDLKRKHNKILKDLSQDEITKLIYDDLGQEIFVTLNFIESVMCSNVSLEAIPPSRAKNAMRARKGQVPFDTYHVLTIGAGRERVRLAGEMGGGTHASPRLHVRRGHFRRLPSGRTTLVHAHYVGSLEAGRVSKDYKVEGPIKNAAGPIVNG